MFRWLKTGLAGLAPDECDVLENYVIRWQIHGQMWLRDTDWTDNPEGYGAPWKEEHQRRLEPDPVPWYQNRLCQHPVSVGLLWPDLSECTEFQAK